MSGFSAFGTQLKMGRGDTVPGPETFDLISGVSSIGGPAFAVDTIDVTAHDSPGSYEETIATIIRTGEISLDLNYNPNAPTHRGITSGGIQGLLAALAARAAKNFQLIFPTSPTVTWSLSGVVTGFEPSAPYDDKLAASVTIKVTGQPTLA